MHLKKSRVKEKKVTKDLLLQYDFLDQLDKFVDKFETKNTCRVKYNIENLNIKKTK